MWERLTLSDWIRTGGIVDRIHPMCERAARQTRLVPLSCLLPSLSIELSCIQISILVQQMPMPCCCSC